MKGEERADFGYDFWYQPYHNVMIGTEFGAPKFFFKAIQELQCVHLGFTQLLTSRFRIVFIRTTFNRYEDHKMTSK